ncbi:hypothetical protein MBELCI_2042 [Limimaricola cinnabarinus LL-001]|uniref:Uncharacterized protein n=1 Tax=Limimaricola cinnabarinus LL-001 TaxID=1337093 RepID=U2Z3N0_9RHOB|nr:hypothetical protein MBELCI_2042 [Limimaricola cinnabarinus LL-001]
MPLPLPIERGRQAVSPPPNAAFHSRPCVERGRPGQTPIKWDFVSYRETNCQEVTAMAGSPGITTPRS